MRPEGAFPFVKAAFWGGFWAGLVLGALSFGVAIASPTSPLPPMSLWGIVAAGVQCTIFHGLVLSSALALLAAVMIAGAMLIGWRASSAPVGLRVLSGKRVYALLAIGLFGGLALADRALITGHSSQRLLGQKNLVLIVVDALRADRLGCYGHSRPTSPNIDALARRAVLFERAITQYPATGPSFGSLFTGKYPRRHGLSGMDPRLWLGGEFNLTLAEILSAEGYRTGAILTGSLTRSSGLARGFETLFEEMPRYATYDVRSPWQVLRSRLPISRAYVRWKHTLDRKLVVTEAERWMEEHRTEPFFLFLHLYDTHSPYDSPEEYVRLFDPGYDGRFRSFRTEDLREIERGRVALEPRDVERLGVLYDAAVRSADESVGRVLEKLRELGLSEDTIVVLTADHGEELYEHGMLEHGHIFNTNLHVPLLLSVPGSPASGRRIPEPVELIDVLPTLLALLKIQAPKGIDGREIAVDSERAAKEGESSYAFSEVGCGPVSRDRSDCRISVQDRRWKLTIKESAPMVELFDLQSDPLEHRNVARENEAIAKRLEARLRKWDSSQPDLELMRSRIGEKNKEIEDRLRALGYVR